jgi:RHS repeat-associated protein
MRKAFNEYGPFGAMQARRSGEMKRTRPGLARCHSPYFRNTPWSRLHTYRPVIAMLPTRSRTCFEGPFGEVIRATGPMAKANPFRFSTKYQDDETDLLYYGYRYYGASDGTWMSREPLAEAAFLRGHLASKPLREHSLIRQESLLAGYVAARNDLLNASDYLGLQVKGPYNNCCCDDCTTEYYRKILLSRYQRAKEYLDPHRPNPMPDEGPWACLSVSINILNFMAPTPPCWTCYVEERWEDKRGGPYNTRYDENTIVCESHPKSGNPKKIIFDYWWNRPAGEDYDIWFSKSHPLPGVVMPTARHADCAHRAMRRACDYAHLDAIVRPTTTPNPPRNP